MTTAALGRTGVELRRAASEARGAWNGTACLAVGAIVLAALVPLLSLPGVRTDALANTVYLLWLPGPDEIYISSKSEAGMCFYLMEAAATGARYATAADPACGPADTQTYGNGW